MANSTSPVPQVVEGSGAVAKINQLFDAASNSLIGGRNAATSALLVWGYLGGRINNINVSNGTLTLTASTTNYIVMKKSDGVVSFSTATTNWNDSTNYWRLYSSVTSSTTVTSYTDERLSAEGIFAGGGGGGGFSNPMTTTGDIIYSSSGSTPARLGVGTNGYVLTLAGGVPTWAAASSGFANPMTTSQDLIVGGSSGSAGRLAVGGDGQVLTVTSGSVGWAAASSGFTNPMTTVGDLIIGGTAGAAGRLAAGTSAYVLTSNGPGAAPSWQAGGGGSSQVVLIATTTDATLTTLTTDGGAASGTNQIILANNSIKVMDMTITGISTVGTSAAWQFQVHIYRGASAGTTSVSGSTTTALGKPGAASTWDISPAADTTYGGLKVRVTGAAGVTIHWKCVVNLIVENT